MKTTAFRPWVSICAAFALAILVAAPARAGESADKAQNLIDDAEYDQAARVLRDALSRGGLGKDELIELYSLQGTVMVALSRRDRAEAAFRNLLVASPGFELPRGTSPKVREVFDAVSAELAESGASDQAFKPEHIPAGSVAPGNDVTLRLDIGASERAAEIAKVQLFYRRLGTPHYQSVFANQTPDGGYQGAVPGFDLDSETEDYAIEYYIEASDAAEARLTGVGTSTLPLSFEVLGTAVGQGDPNGGDGSTEDDGSTLMTVGVIVGAVVVVAALVGGGIGLYILLNQEGEGSAQVTVNAP